MDYFFVIFSHSIFLSQLSLKQLDKFRFQENLMKSDKYFNNHQQYLTERIYKPDSIFYLQIFSDFLFPMQLNQVLELNVHNIEFISDKLLKHKNVLILIYVVQAVYIWPKWSTDL